jgi:integrase
VYETDEAGKKVLDKRGEPIVRYSYWQATYEVPQELLPPGVKRRRLTGNGVTQVAALRALSENKSAFYDRKENGQVLFRTPRKRGTVRKTVDDLFTDWLAHKTDEAITSTVLRKYRRLYEQHVQPHIGKEFLDKITDRQLLQLLNSTLPSKKKKDSAGKPMPETVLLGMAARLNIWRVLRMAFRWGELRNYFAGRGNPMMLVKQPKVVKRIIDIDARVEQSDRIMAYLEKHRPELLALMGLQLLGLRQSERLGLRLEDVWGIDTDHPKLMVRGQLARWEKEDMIRNGDGRRWYWRDKTKTGVQREIPLTEPFLGYLKEHLKRREAIANGEKFKDWGDDPIGQLLFLTDRGAVISKNTDVKIWTKVCEAAGVIPYPQHENRFVTAARLAALKPAVPANVVRSIIGHESEAIGYYYQRVTSDNSEEALTRYGASYGAKKVKAKKA